MKTDSTHQKTFEQAAKQTEEELRRRLAVEDYNDPKYLPSEVLVSFFKLRFGQAVRLLDAIVSTLDGRIVGLVERFFRARPGALRGGDAAKEDAVSSVWEALSADNEPVGQGFAEVRFLPFVDRKLKDFLRQARRQERNTTLFSQMEPEQVDGEQVAFENTVAADDEDQPESEAERNALKARLERLMTTDLPEKQKLAVYFRLEHGYEWKRVAELLQCSIPTARNHYKLGKQRLLGELDDGLEND